MKSSKMPRLVFALFAFMFGLVVHAMPTKEELAQAQPLVNDLTADDLRALKAKEKTPGDVAAAHLALADKAETEAGKYLLLQGAFRLYVRSGDYDSAAAALQRMRGEIADLPPEVIVEIVNKEMRRVASEKAPKVLAIFRDAQRVIKYRKQLAAAELDATAHPENVRCQRSLAECHACLGEWPKAIAIFAKIGDEAAKWELGMTKDCDTAKAADFWWNYKASDQEPFKVHAAALYKKGLEDGSITGLRKTLAEKRIKQMEGVLVVAQDMVSSAASYCVIDLSAGPTASRYPVNWLAKPPVGGFNTDEYKTAKLVLHRIESGKFMMGGQYEVTFTKPCYCGIFEVTQKQYELVMGSNPSKHKGDMRPVEQVSWDMLRGDSSKYNWPSSANVDPSTFIGKIQARTGLNFDLPTDAQWEYTCRAGTTSKYNNGGETEDDLKQLGRYKNNQSDGKGGHFSEHTIVGSYLPNAWGLYDMHGNVLEWCLDWKGSLSSGVKDPSGPSMGTHRVLRGGGCVYNNTDYLASFCRLFNLSSHKYFDIGFRLYMNPEAPVGASARGSGAPAASGSDGGRPKTKMLDLGGGVKMEMIYVAPGTFVMGRNGGNPNSSPAHRVTLTKGYWLGRYEVTQRQWKQVMGRTPSKFKGDDLPVDSVSWDDCQSFITKVNARLSGEEVRLPTEAEWECACRAGTDGDFGGTGNLDDMGWYKDNSGDKTHPVGKKRANDWGFYDMHGNVREWCNDRWGSYPQNDVSDPVGSSSGDFRVSRGGGWRAPQKFCLSIQRWREETTFVGETYGFRLCMSADQDAPSSRSASRGSDVSAASGSGVAETSPVTVTTSDSVSEPSSERPKDMALTLSGGVTMDFVGCPAGSFMMGKSGDSDPQSATYEHKVTITRPFWIGKYQVTWRQWKVFCKEQFGDVVAALGGLDAAKGAVQYNMAMFFCEAMTKKVKREISQGYVCRLPTEAEWEYALRANCTDPSDPYVNRREYNIIGVSKDDKMALFKKYGLPAKQIPQVLPPAKVGMKKPNAWGIYDMVGNGPEVILDTCQIRNFMKRKGRNEHNDLTGAFPYKENEIDPLYFSQDNAPSFCSCHIWGGMKRASKIGSPVGENITFRIVIGPDLLKERGIKMPKLGK